MSNENVEDRLLLAVTLLFGYRNCPTVAVISFSLDAESEPGSLGFAALEGNRRAPPDIDFGIQLHRPQS
jgi:hypothetical protein